MRGAGIRTLGAALAAVLLAAILGLAAASSAGVSRDVAGPQLARGHGTTFGHSRDGRALRFTIVGDRRARRHALIVGQIHGDEPQGRRVAARVRHRYKDLKGVKLWVISTVNPDGSAHGSRTNSRGVDLNRNFGVQWRAGEPPGSGYYPGPHAYSEPETRAGRKLVKRIEPRVSIWLHQPWGQVLAPRHGRAKEEKAYSRISGVPLQRARGEDLPGTAIRWSDARVGGNAFVVELGPNPLSRQELSRNARAAATVLSGHPVR
ncbi:hypothetical protein BH10ACT11_BH10ACT11_08730 [soil metagenome]